MTEVPIKYKCPVCGKWGRRHAGPIPGRWYHCNPKARTGGPGCGEVFRRLDPSCEKHGPIWHELANMQEIGSRYAGMNEIQRKAAMGYYFLERLKEAGRFDPHKRKIAGLHGFSQNGLLCDCGCGRPVGIEKRRWASSKCANMAYAVSEMVGHQSEKLLWFLVELHGHKCAKCGDVQGPFDVDHIVEVADGGGMCWIENFQLLCRNTCHKEKSKAFAGKRAKERREAKKEEKKQKIGRQITIFDE